MMKDLLINASILSNRNTGLGVYTYNMLEHACPILDQYGISYDVMCGDSSYLPDCCRDKAKVVPFAGFISRNYQASKIYNQGYKLVWSTTQHGALFTKTKQIITIHDITPYLYPKGRQHQALYYKLVVPILINKSVIVITDSENTKKDIIEKYSNRKWNKSKLRVIHAAIAEKDYIATNFSDISKQYNLEKEKYFCITGIHYEYKNIHMVINTYLKYKDFNNYKVVIIGNDRNEYGEYLHSLVKENNLEKVFVFTGFISDEDKLCLLKNSLASIYPSKYEGFGLPLLEAMQAQIPVISSNASSLPEVGGNAALFFNPNNIEELAADINFLINNPDERSRLIELGVENLKRFNWRDSALMLVDILRSQIN